MNILNVCQYEALSSVWECCVETSHLRDGQSFPRLARNILQYNVLRLRLSRYNGGTRVATIRATYRASEIPAYISDWH